MEKNQKQQQQKKCAKYDKAGEGRGDQRDRTDIQAYIRLFILSGVYQYRNESISN